MYQSPTLTLCSSDWICRIPRMRPAIPMELITVLVILEKSSASSWTDREMRLVKNGRNERGRRKGM